jgi:nitrite reductase/ring-hydroxylating ferredoxin subunit
VIGVSASALIPPSSPNGGGQSAYARSLEALRSCWIVAGMVGEFRRSGDFRTRDIGDVSVLVIRDDDHFNVCRNLCPHENEPFTRRHEAGNIVRFVCPFHGWTFDRAGLYQPGLVTGGRTIASAAPRDRDLETFEVRVSAGFVWVRIASGPATDEPNEPETRFGAPSMPLRLIVDRDWQAVAERVHDLAGSDVIAPNSAICRTTDGMERLFVTVVPIGPDRCELIAWTDLESASGDRGITTVLRRRAFLDVIAADTRVLDNDSLPS